MKTRKQIFDALDKYEPISQMEFFTYAKSIKIYTEAYNFGEAIAIADGITNTGASRIYIATSHDLLEALYEITEHIEDEKERELIEQLSLIRMQDFI